MKILSIITMGVCLGLYSCSEPDLSGYHYDDFIQFYKSSKDSTVFSFAYDESLETEVVKLKLNIISGLENRDRKYEVQFLPEESTAKEGEDFEFAGTEHLILKNDSVSWLEVQVKKSANVKQKSVTAVFEVVESEDFKPGLQEFRKARVVISNTLSRPEWWDDWHETNGLGTYSDTKYTTFIREMKISDLTLIENGGTMDYSTMRAYVLKFKYWLADNPTEDENGPMKVAMRG